MLICEDCLNATYDNSFYPTMLQKCDSCGKEVMCMQIPINRLQSRNTGEDSQSDEVTKVGAIDLFAKPKPIATNKKEKKKFNMKVNHKPKGSSNTHIRRKT